MAQVTLQDVARRAGVSYATVDRVVNERGGVSAKSAERVQHAIAALQYQRDVNAANLARQRVYRFHFVLPDDSNAFFHLLNSALEFYQSRQDSNRSQIQCTRVNAFNTNELVATLDSLASDQCDCICIVALDTPAVIEAVDRARKRGLKLVTLISDIPAECRDHYVGIDNLVAGRTAGRMMGLAHGRGQGKVLPVIGSHAAQDHIERLNGFETVMRTYYPQIALLPPVESRDRPERVSEALSDTLAAHCQFSGVYNIGAGNEGLVQWLQGSSSSSRPVSIIHELVPASRAGLEAGLIDAVIDQKPMQTIAEALRVMRLLSDHMLVESDGNDITPAIYLRENLPVEEVDSQCRASV